MTAALTLLPPVIDQSIHRVSLDPWSAAGFAAVASLAAYLALRRSPWTAALLALAVPFAIYRDVGQTTLTLLKCVALGTTVGFLCGGAPLLPRSAGARRVAVAGCGVLAAIALSGAFAAHRMDVAREFFKQAEYLVLLWCAASCIERIPYSASYLATGIATATAIVATFAVSQATIGGAPSGMWVNGHALPRVAGSLEGPNQLAGYLEAALPVLWVWPLLGSAWNPLRVYAAAAAAAALVLSQSRAGLIVAAAAYAFAWRWQRAVARSVAAPMAIGAAAGIGITLVWFVGYAHASFADIIGLLRLDIPGQPGSGVGTRAQLWPAAIEIFKEHPILGAGAGNFQLLLPSVGLYGVKTQAASLPLQTLAEQGIVGLVALVVFAAVSLRETFARRLGSPLALAAFLALAALLAHQLVDDLFFYPKAAALCWLLLGAGSATAPSSVASRPGEVTTGSDASAVTTRSQGTLRGRVVSQP